MNPPQVYTCSQSWTPLPPPSPYHPSGILCSVIQLYLTLWDQASTFMGFFQARILEWAPILFSRNIQTYSIWWQLDILWYIVSYLFREKLFTSKLIYCLLYLHHTILSIISQSQQSQFSSLDMIIISKVIPTNQSAIWPRSITLHSSN